MTIFKCMFSRLISGERGKTDAVCQRADSPVVFVLFCHRVLISLLLSVYFQGLTLVAFICAIVWVSWTMFGGGWVQFVTISAFLTTLIWFIIHLIQLVHRLRNWMFIVSRFTKKDAHYFASSIILHIYSKTTPSSCEGFFFALFQYATKLFFLHVHVLCVFLAFCYWRFWCETIFVLKCSVSTDFIKFLQWDLVFAYFNKLVRTQPEIKKCFLLWCSDYW